MYKVNRMGQKKLTLNGVTFSCSNARVNHNELRTMFGFLLPSYIPGMSIKLHSVTSQQGKHVTAGSEVLKVVIMMLLVTLFQPL